MKVSEDLWKVLAHSQRLAKQTDGAFDITVGPVVQLWRRARRARELPDPKRLARALELVGHNKLQLDEGARTAQLLKQGMLLDLGGIAKGYAADQALALLKRHGIRSALVAAGGDIAVSDSPPGSSGWTISIAGFGKNGATPAAWDDLARTHLVLSNAAVSTSGDAEQHVEINGQRYSHIVNPKTGVGIVSQSSATVVAPEGISSDGLATAVSVLGSKRGLELIDSTDGAAALILLAGERGLQSFESRRWKDVPKARP